MIRGWMVYLIATASIAVGALRAPAEDNGVAKAGRTIRAFRAERPLSLDGDLTKWSGAEPIKFESRPLGGHPRRASVYALWDRHFLYIAFDVYSSKLQAAYRARDAEKLCEDDGVEFLIDAHRDRTKQYLPDDFAYHINVLNVVYDDRGTPAGRPDSKWNGEARHNVKVLDDFHYLVEAAVPWTEIGLKAQEGKTSIGIDFCVNGKDPATRKYDYFDWCELKVFHDPSGFGDLVLIGRRKALP